MIHSKIIFYLLQDDCRLEHYFELLTPEQEPYCSEYARYNGSRHLLHGSFPKSGALIWTPNSRPIILRTPTKGPPFIESATFQPERHSSGVPAY